MKGRYNFPFPVINYRKRFGKIKKRRVKRRDRTQKYWAFLKSFKALSGNENFDRLTKALRSAGYKVRVQYIQNYSYPLNIPYIPYYFASVSGNNLRAGYCTENDSSYTYINNHIAIDRKDYFDKWSKCVYQIELPATDEAVKEILDAIDDTVNHYYNRNND